MANVIKSICAGMVRIVVTQNGMLEIVFFCFTDKKRCSASKMIEKNI